MKEFKYCPLCSAPLAEIRENRIECSKRCGFVHYDNPTPVAAVVVEYDGKIVFAHNSAWQGDFYGLITGFVDYKEGPEECAVREVKEELDLDATSPTLVGVYPFERLNQVIIGYHVLASGVITLNEELDRYKLIAPEDCVAWPTGTGHALRDWLRSQGIEPTMRELPGRVS